MARFQQSTVPERFADELGKRRAIAALDTARAALETGEPVSEVVSCLREVLKEFEPIRVTDSWINLAMARDPGNGSVREYVATPVTNSIESIEDQ